MYPTFAELIDHLFQTHKRPDGKEYSLTEVSEALNGAVAPSYLSRLRNGKINNPGRETIIGLCRFFKVTPTYFFPELEDLDLENKEYTRDITIIFRGDTLDQESRLKLNELIVALNRSQSTHQ
ncbi:helix-turn-helix domain-containing protein [Herpetosiphon giganteus]|uniref:helix-turn-helix domain-containing protein n=1 Tax=Herpetosiphon giganteus TaxID=2029754 RepID=UPI0019593429|nr:transcriptional regulator with XRE-family HTH domain [Herpetosiphon giganteus]